MSSKDSGDTPTFPMSDWSEVSIRKYAVYFARFFKDYQSGKRELKMTCDTVLSLNSQVKVLRKELGTSSSPSTTSTFGIGGGQSSRSMVSQRETSSMLAGVDRSTAESLFSKPDPSQLSLESAGIVAKIQKATNGGGPMGIFKTSTSKMEKKLSDDDAMLIISDIMSCAPNVTISPPQPDVQAHINAVQIARKTGVDVPPLRYEATLDLSSFTSLTRITLLNMRVLAVRGVDQVTELRLVHAALVVPVQMQILADETSEGSGVPETVTISLDGDAGLSAGGQLAAQAELQKKAPDLPPSPLVGNNNNNTYGAGGGSSPGAKSTPSKTPGKSKRDLVQDALDQVVRVGLDDWVSDQPNGAGNSGNGVTNASSLTHAVSNASMADSHYDPMSPDAPMPGAMIHKTCTATWKAFPAVSTLRCHECQPPLHILSAEGIARLASTLKTIELVDAIEGKSFVFFRLPDVKNTWQLVHEVDFSKNTLERIDSSWELLRNLVKINLSHNRLTQLHPCFKTFESLKTLIISSNFITSSKKIADDLPIRIEHLDISQNRLTSAVGFGTLTEILSINLNANQLKSWRDLTTLAEKCTKLMSIFFIENPMCLEVFRGDIVKLGYCIFSSRKEIRINGHRPTVWTPQQQLELAAKYEKVFRSTSSLEDDSADAVAVDPLAATTTTSGGGIVTDPLAATMASDFGGGASTVAGSINPTAQILTDQLNLPVSQVHRLLDRQSVVGSSIAPSTIRNQPSGGGGGMGGGAGYAASAFGGYSASGGNRRSGGFNPMTGSPPVSPVRSRHNSTPPPAPHDRSVGSGLGRSEGSSDIGPNESASVRGSQSPRRSHHRSSRRRGEDDEEEGGAEGGHHRRSRRHRHHRHRRHRKDDESRSGSEQEEDEEETALSGDTGGLCRAK